MNVELQCCALFIVLVISALFFRERKLDLNNRTLFVRALCVCIITICLDILSIVAIYCAYYHSFSPILTKIICKLYILTLVLQGYLGYVYIMTDVFSHKQHNQIKQLLHWTFLIGELTILVTPISYTLDDQSVYSYGISTNIAFILAAIFICVIISIGFICKNKISHRKFSTMIIWQGIWLICGVIQFINSNILLISFASAFSIVILYTQLENPNTFIDNETGAFNKDALILYVKDKYKFNQKFAAFTIKINFISSIVDLELENETRFRIAKDIMNLGPDPVFMLDENILCIICKDQYRMHKLLMRIREMNKDITDVPANNSYIVIPNSNDFINSEEFFKFLHAYENSDDEIIEANDRLISKLRKYDKIHDLINDALEHDRVEVYYQPFYNTATKKFSVAEALVRIKNEYGTIISPGMFIPIAEETGQIIPLGIRIFEKVCKFISEHDIKKLGLNSIDINLSAAQFDFENPAKFIMNTIDKYKIDPALINLEITETANNRNKENLINNVNQLIKHGITFSLDDFGTGRSNLDYFVDLPVTNIKFDNSFTQGYFKNDKIKHVLEGMTEIMHKMNMNIVSEGIETKEQLEAMSKIGIEYIQGFYFSKPIPEDEFIEFLSQNNVSE